MRFALRPAIYTLFLAATGLIAFGQSSTPASKTSPHKTTSLSKKYCHASAGFCFRYPGTWSVLGEIFDGNGVVIAPEQNGDRALWDEITIALVAPPAEDGQGTTLDAIIQQATEAMRGAGENFETLQRQERTVDHSPAQMLKTRYRENSTGRDWLEELVFIEGPQNEIYSVALKCAPEHLLRLEPALKEVLASWTMPEPGPPSQAGDSSTSEDAHPGGTTSSPTQPH